MLTHPMDDPVQLIQLFALITWRTVGQLIRRLYRLYILYPRSSHRSLIFNTYFNRFSIGMRTLAG